MYNSLFNSNHELNVAEVLDRVEYWNDIDTPQARGAITLLINLLRDHYKIAK